MGKPLNIIFAATVPGVEPNPLMIIPFGMMLLAIALMPFIHRHWWEHQYPKVAAVLGAITATYYTFSWEVEFECSM